MTSDGGLLLLREVDRRLGLIARVDELIADPRDPLYTAHPQAEMLTSRIFGIAAGYEDANDHQQLRHDPAFQVAAGRTPAENNYDEDNYPLASPSTISRLENRVDAKTCLKLNELFVDIFLESFQEPPEEIVLDYDATDDPTHGNQDKRYFNQSSPVSFRKRSAGSKRRSFGTRTRNRRRSYRTNASVFLLWQH